MGNSFRISNDREGWNFIAENLETRNRLLRIRFRLGTRICKIGGVVLDDKHFDKGLETGTLLRELQ